MSYSGRASWHLDGALGACVRLFQAPRHTDWLRVGSEGESVAVRLSPEEMITLGEQLVNRGHMHMNIRDGVQHAHEEGIRDRLNG